MSLAFRERGIEFEEVNPAELERHRNAGTSAEPIAWTARTSDIIKGRIHRSMIVYCKRPYFPSVTTGHRDFYHWFRLRNSLMCAT